MASVGIANNTSKCFEKYEDEIARFAYFLCRPVRHGLRLSNKKINNDLSC